MPSDYGSLESLFKDLDVDRTCLQSFSKLINVHSPVIIYDPMLLEKSLDISW